MRQLKISPNITNRENETIERYLQEIGRERRITLDEEVELAHRIHQGDELALEQLAKANLRFVVSVAKQYQGQGMGLTDLINEGNVGLITAARKFDETRGFKFISYAVWWIRQSILQALANNGRIVRLPSNQLTTLTRVKRFLHDFTQQNERTPSTEEVAEALHLDYEKANTILLMSDKHASIDAPVVEDEDVCLLDLIARHDGGETDSHLVSESLSQEIDHALSLLPEKEATIIRLYFGIHAPELTLDEISAKLHLSRERVRQIKEKGLTILRSAQISNVLKSYL